jgi:hypothetical protein
MNIVQERIDILYNSVKFLELIVQKLRDQKITFLPEEIQKRIKSYREELQLYEIYRQ